MRWKSLLMGSEGRFGFAVSHGNGFKVNLRADLHFIIAGK